MTRLVNYDPMGILSEINRLFDNSGYPFKSSGRHAAKPVNGCLLLMLKRMIHKVSFFNGLTWY